MTVSERYVQSSDTGWLSYRRVFPSPIRPYLEKPRTEHKVALGARSLREPGACQRCEDAHHDYERDLRKARAAAGAGRPLIDDEAIAFIAGLVRQDGLAIHEDVQWDDRPTDIKRSWMQRVRTNTLEDLQEWREVRGIGDIRSMMDWWGDEAASHAEYEGYRVDRTAPQFAILCREVHDAQIEVLELILRRLDGDAVPTPPMPRNPIRTRTAGTDTTAEAVPGETFAAIVARVMESKSDVVGVATQQATQTALRFFTEVLGDVVPTNIRKAEITNLKELLAQRPSSLPKVHRALPGR